MSQTQFNLYSLKPIRDNHLPICIVGSVIRTTPLKPVPFVTKGRANMLK